MARERERERERDREREATEEREREEVLNEGIHSVPKPHPLSKISERKVQCRLVFYLLHGHLGLTANLTTII